MTRGEILRKLRDVMKSSSPEQMAWDSVNEDCAIDKLGFDSLSILDLIYEIQQAFGVQFEAEQMIGVRTVGDLVTFLEKRTT